MKITLYGTRGSIPVSGVEFVRYGGNTTSLRIESSALPSGVVLAIDAGSGYPPLIREALKHTSHYWEIVTLFTHYHRDHVLGLAHAVSTYQPSLHKTFIGPVDDGFSVRDMHESIMCPPIFPIAASVVAPSHSYEDIVDLSGAIAFHPQHGRVMLSASDLAQVRLRSLVQFENASASSNECLVITWTQTNHSETTLSYRFDDGPTGKVFVFVTDHEPFSGEMPEAFLRHLQGANVLVIDTQFAGKAYERSHIGWGHGTPSHSIGCAEIGDIPRIGFTHHDPLSSDENIDAIVEEGRSLTKNTRDVFGCFDGQVIEV